MTRNRHLLATRLLPSLFALLTAQSAWADDVKYLEFNTSTKTFGTKNCTSFTTVSDQTSWTAGWYVANGEVTIETRIIVTGDVHLILADGATFNATKGIGCTEGNSITIYGQSNDEATMGVLECGQGLGKSNPEYGYAAIGGENSSSSPVNGTITIHGGKILAHGTDFGAAIGGGYGNQSNKKDFGAIIINGGVVSADNNGQCSAVIGGGTYMTRGNITINGGKVTAYNSNAGGQGAKIGGGGDSSWGIITINGGEITVSGFMGAQMGNMGAGIGGGVFMTTTDNMTAPELDQIIITGGTINASAAYAGAAIGGGMRGKCGTIRISGGNITANAGLAAAAIGNGNGVSVNEGNIVITGGVINATANASNARGAIGGSAKDYGPTITLSWTDAENDRITATTTNANYRGIHGSSVTIADGKSFTDTENRVYNGTLTTEQLAAMNGKTLSPCTIAAISLADNADNSSTISEANGTSANVTLQGRTLYKDGSWNTLCLPFSVSTASGILSGDNVQAMTLNTETSSLTDGTLTLNFTDATGQTIPAGTPFIIKWDKPTNYVAYNGTNAATCSDLVSPVFDGVSVSDATNDATVEGVLTFTGTYAPVTIGSEGDNTKLYLGADNKLFYPTKARTIGTHRAYFQLADGITAGAPVSSGSAKQIRAFNLNFFDDEATGILTTNFTNSSNEWYSLDGRMLNGKPTRAGVYINNGRKVIVK